ncbi:PspC domain-containing protein [Arsenicicoccus cauae]|nr:PspC domain-containing protein [Arsenicicoccus cauae]
MTQQPPPTPPGPPEVTDRQPDALDRFFRGVRETGIRRRLSHRWVAGVCGGVADKIGVDPLVVRLVWIALLVMGGIAFPAYFVAFLLLADAKDEIPLEKALRHGDGDSVVLLAFTLLVSVGGVTDAFGLNDGSPAGSAGGIVVLVLLGAGGYVWWTRRGQARPGGGGTSAISPTGTATSHILHTPDTPDTPDTPGAPTAPDASDAHPLAGGGDAQPAAETTQLPIGGTSLDTVRATGDAVSPASSPAMSWPAAPEAPAGSRSEHPISGATRVHAHAAYVPARRRRPTLGWPGTAAAIGLAAAGIGAVLAADQTGRIHLDHPYAVAAAAALALVSALLVVVGLAGRRGGFTVPLVLALAIVTLALGGPLRLDVADGGTTISSSPMDQRWAPTTLDGTSAYRVGAGGGVLDLTSVDRASLHGQEVSLQVGVGEMTVRVPQGMPVRVKTQIGLGDAVVRHPDGSRTDLGETDTTIGTGTPVLVLRGQIGLGDLIIEEVAP